MIHTYPDGSTIEIGGGSTHPPGWTGQHGTVNWSWVRKNGGEWRLPDQVQSRSTHRLREWIFAGENADEVWDCICSEKA